MPLLIAAVAALAVASAQSARPPAPSLNFTDGSEYFYPPILQGTSQHTFTLQFGGKGNSGPLVTSFAIDSGDSGFTLGTDGCNGKTLSAKTRSCTGCPSS